MAQVRQFLLPDVGEGLTEADIVSWKVRPGDTVTVNQTVVEIETAKSLVELPSPFAGEVHELLAEEGQTVAVGRPILSVDVGPAGVSQGSAAVGDSPGQEPEAGSRTSVLVGYGPRTTQARRRPRAGAAPLPGGVPPAEPAAVRVLAKPPVRKLAKDLGVDLRRCAATGPQGTVTREDVHASLAADSPGTGERETRVAVSGVRRRTAEAMVSSAFSAPHATTFLTVDVSRTVRLTRRLRRDPELAGVPVSPLLLVAKALLVALRRHPGVNAAWDEATKEIVVKHYVNLGIAASTPRGLLVPVIDDADRMSLRQLAEAMQDLVETAREGRTNPAAMTGGTITVTNVGIFGVDSGTPILNPGEAAILCLGAIHRRPWVHKGRVKPRWVTQLALSFDHRIVDGDLGGRFLADVAAVLEDPTRALLWG